MTLTISDTTMTSDRSHCTACYAPDRNGWEVSWLPGQLLNRNTAITAMTLADTAAEHDLHDRHPLLPHVEGWAEELGLTEAEAIARASQPPSVIDPSKSQPAGSPAARQPIEQPGAAAIWAGLAASRVGGSPSWPVC